MKRTILIGVLLSLSTSPASAQPDWVERFLGRYEAKLVEPSAGSPARLASPGFPRQGGGLALTVRDVVRLTLENNLDVRVNRFSPLASEQLIQTYYRPFDPTVRISANVDRATEPSRTQLAGARSLSQLTHTYTLGYTHTLETGTAYGVDARVLRTSSNSTFSTVNPAYFTNITYSFNQPFLRDFGQLINTSQIRVAQNNLEISKLQFEQQLIDLVTEAQKLYWDLVFTLQDVEVKQRSLELAEKTLADNQRQVEIGTLAPIDLVQTESEVASRREQLLVASFGADQIQDQVKTIITSQADPGLALVSLNPADGARQPSRDDIVDIEQAIRMALENRPELRQIDLEMRNKDIDVAYTKNQLLPTLDIVLSYSQRGVGGVELLRAAPGLDAPIISITETGLGRSLSQAFGFDFTGYNIGFNFELPLGNRAAEAEHARALTENRLAQARHDALAQRIALEVRNAHTQIEMNRARIESAQTARELAQKQLEAEETKFQVGISTVRFVLEEQRNLAVSESNESQALINYTKAIADFDRAIGRTLRKNSVQIEDALQPSIANRTGAMLGN